MWQNNGYQSNGSYHNNFNENEYPTSPFTVGSSTPMFSPDLMQFENSNGDGFISQEFQPETGLFNDGAYMQNQFLNSHLQVSVKLTFVNPR
jgi:hypothetical protein